MGYADAPILSIANSLAILTIDDFSKSDERAKTMPYVNLKIFYLSVIDTINRESYSVESEG